MKQRFLLLALCACALACDSANPVAPSGTVLSVVANPTQIGLTGESTITVTGFKPDANPLNPGTQIILTTSIGNLFHPTTGAQISIVEIDGTGRAVAMLRADGRSGEATVTATLTTTGGGGGGGGGEGGGGATTGTSASVTVQVGQVEGDRPSLTISANPSIIPVLGVSRISLLGRNSDNTPVSAGQRIRLTSDLGELVADGGNANSPRIDSVVTNANGEAFLAFIAGSRSGTGTVSAILGTSDEVAVEITIRTALDRVVLTADPLSIQRLDTGVPISLTAVLTDIEGAPLASTIVTFQPQLGSLDRAAVPTNAQGVATATLTVNATDVSGVGANQTFAVRATATSEGVTREDDVAITVQGSP